MMRFKFLSLLLLPVIFLSGTAGSAPLSGLYEVEVPVADQAAANRPGAMAEALRQVVVKVSGSSGAVGNPALAGALKAPAPYVQQYSYRNNDAQGAKQPLLMVVSFDQKRIDQLLLSGGLSIWSTRPLTIVWLAVEQGSQQLLVGAGDRGLLKGVLLNAAQRRGLPLRLPLLDKTDQAKVKASNLWSDFHDPIIQASQRYEAQAVLMGRLEKVGVSGRWQVRWSLYQAGRVQRWTQSSDNVEALVAYGIDKGSDALASTPVRTPVEAAGGTELHWVVNEVRDMRNHRRVMDYLASLRGVISVQPEQVTGDSLRLRIITSSGETALRQQLGYDNRLLPLDAAAYSTPGAAGLVQPGDLVYRLAP